MGDVNICTQHFGFASWAFKLDVTTGDDFLFRRCPDPECDWFAWFYIAPSDVSWKTNRRTTP